MDEPHLKVGDLSLWVLGREFPEASNGWDEEWLSIRATIRGKASSVTTEGPILMTADFDRFRNELVTMHATLAGTASLSGYEPNLKVILAAHERGGVSGDVDITSDHLSESHHFEFELDQSYLPAIIVCCDAILERFPILGNLAT